MLSSYWRWLDFAIVSEFSRVSYCFSNLLEQLSYRAINADLIFESAQEDVDTSRYILSVQYMPVVYHAIGVHVFQQGDPLIPAS